MNSEKKVIFLFLLLIILIISCVYFHTQEIYNTQVANTTKNKDVDYTPIQEQKPEIEVKQIAKQEAKLNTESIQESLENNQNKQIQEDIEKDVQKTQEIIAEEKTLVVEKKEPEIKKIEPLVKIDRNKYLREANEKYIQDLSIATQELQLKINEIVLKSPIIFKRASTNILRKSEITIDKIARLLKKHNNIKIEIAGHTDSAGADELNKRVSIQRAEKIKELIASYGITEDRLIARGYGEDIPLVENNENGYSLINRRVEFNIVEE